MFNNNRCVSACEVNIMEDHALSTIKYRIILQHLVQMSIEA
jgi:hypothetical protein